MSLVNEEKNITSHIGNSPRCGTADNELLTAEREALSLLASNNKSEAQFERLFTLEDWIAEAAVQSDSDIVVKLRRLVCPTLGLSSGYEPRHSAAIQTILAYLSQKWGALRPD